MPIVKRTFLPLLLTAALAGSAAAQEAKLQLNVSRLFGFGLGSQIQGHFRLEASGPADLQSVTFTLDGAVIGTAEAPPFRIEFQTDDYAAGWHTLAAVGRTAGGRQLASAERRFEFVTADQAWQALPGMLMPLGVIILLVMSLNIVLPLVWSRRKTTLPLGAPRNYGLLGGAVCPRCGRPFALHFWGLNISLVGKLDRCDHCGRWSFVRRASLETLRAAEAEEARLAQPEGVPAEPSPEEKLRRQADESRFMDGS